MACKSHPSIFVIKKKSSDDYYYQSNTDYDYVINEVVLCIVYCCPWKNSVAKLLFPQSKEQQRENIYLSLSLLDGSFSSEEETSKQGHN